MTDARRVVLPVVALVSCRRVASVLLLLTVLVLLAVGLFVDGDQARLASWSWVSFEATGSGTPTPSSEPTRSASATSPPSASGSPPASLSPTPEASVTGTPSSAPSGTSTPSPAQSPAGTPPPSPALTPSGSAASSPSAPPQPPQPVAPSQRPPPPPPPPPDGAARRTLYLITRSFAGHRGIFDACFAVALDAFLDWRDAHLTIVLDAESPADREWGAALTLRFAHRPFAVVYADPPPPSILTLNQHTGFGFHGARYNSSGYHRQLYDSFLLDTFLPATARPHDVVAVCDVDAPFMSVLPSADALVAGGGGRLRQQVRATDYFALDGPIIAGNVSHNQSLVGMMDLQYLPQFFFVGTFARFRAHVTAAWAAPSFDAALVAAAVAATAKYAPTGLLDAGSTMFSPCNALLSYGVAFEPGAYGVALVGSAGPAAPVFGFNGRCYQATVPALLRPGCCRSFGLSNCTVADRADVLHIMSAHPFYGGGPEPFPAHEMRRVADAHYAGVAAQLAGVEPAEAARMRGVCELYVAGPAP